MEAENGRNRCNRCPEAGEQHWLVVLAHNGHNVTVWSILEDEVEMLTKEHEHKR